MTSSLPPLGCAIGFDVSTITARRQDQPDDCSSWLILEGMAKSSATTDALAKRVWQAMFDLLIRTAPLRTKSLARRRLTPNDSRALFSLDARTARSMRSLADEWKCDKSNATWIVDRLEELGLARRQVVVHDRRVKLVMLTSKGRKTRAALLDEFHRPPAEFDRLERADLEALDRALTKLTAVASTSNDSTM
jgi:DNA-binding MarR family transcriptional regulator